MSETVGEYIDQIRKRHSRLSMRRMSLESGLSENIIGMVIRGEASISPSSLKRICDRWGTDEDYRHLMKLAGHPLPEEELTADQKQLLEWWGGLSGETQATFVKVLKTVSEMLPEERIDLLAQIWQLVRNRQQEE